MADLRDSDPGLRGLEGDVESPFGGPTPRPRSSGLTGALRRARIESAERSDVIIDLRGAELTRLEMLREHLEPVFAEVPADCDLFDPGIAPGERPRLFIDMVSFVELGRDRRTYQLMQDSRLGRTVIAESERIDVMVRAVTDYMARRLIEREKALASIVPTEPATAPAAPAAAQAREPRPRPRALRILGRSLLFLIEVVGSAVIVAGLVAAAMWAWGRFIP